MTYRWIKLDNGRSVYRKASVERGPASELPAPMLIRDQMDPLRHPITGDMIESKNEFRAITRKNGGEELGNDKQTVSPPRDTTYESDVGEAIRKVNEGYRPNVTETATEGWH